MAHQACKVFGYAIARRFSGGVVAWAARIGELSQLHQLAEYTVVTLWSSVRHQYTAFPGKPPAPHFLHPAFVSLRLLLVPLSATINIYSFPKGQLVLQLSTILEGQSHLEVEK